MLLSTQGLYLCSPHPLRAAFIAPPWLISSVSALPHLAVTLTTFLLSQVSPLLTFPGKTRGLH